MFPGSGRIGESYFVKPARISTSKSGRGPGAYGYSMSYDAWEGKYFLAHPNLKWINVTVKEMPNRNDLVFNDNGDFGTSLFYARMTVETSSQVFQDIGQFNIESETLMYQDKSEDLRRNSNENLNNAVMEVLACVNGGTI